MWRQCSDDAYSHWSAGLLARWHLVEFLQGVIKDIPRLPASCICNKLRRKVTGIVEAAGVNCDHLGGGWKGYKHRRSSIRAERVMLFIAAVTLDTPGFRLAIEDKIVAI